MDISCPGCGETEALSGRPEGSLILLTCGTCGTEWERDPAPRCETCGGTEMRAVPLAIVEKGRGTQLSVVGTRQIHLCVDCDGATIDHWQRNRPNPLLPDDLPTVSEG